MLKRIFAIAAGTGAGALLYASLLHFGAITALWPDRGLSRNTAQVREVMRLIHNRYVEAGASADYTALGKAAIDGMMATLDPHSSYLDARDYRLLKDEFSNGFGGIGVQVEMVENRLTIIAPIRGTPGDKAGLLRGDQILSIDGQTLDGATMLDMISRLRGQPGSLVSIGIRRPSENREFDVRIRRERIRVESVKETAPDANGIALIEITHFGETTGAEFHRALAHSRTLGARALIIDLRNNPGGLLEAAVEVASPFFNRNERIVYTQGRLASDRVELRGDGKEPMPQGWPIAILINGGSASASEIVAGALKDTGRAILVGEKSFGKGSVQSIFPLRDRSALRLTTAKYFTPSGTVIDGHGITPDIEVELTPEEEKAVALQHLRNDITDPDEFEKRFDVEWAPDRQLEAARNALLEKMSAASREKSK